MSNMRKASGPKTAAGKRRSRQNARKHGLAAVLEVDDCSVREAQLEAILSGQDATPLVKRAAAHRVGVERVARARAALVRALIEESAETNKPLADREGVLHLIENLRRLQRYERRALSRWLKSVTKLVEEQALGWKSTYADRGIVMPSEVVEDAKRTSGHG